MILDATQLEQTAKLLSNKLDTVAVDWKLTCDEVYITTTRLNFVIPLSTLDVNPLSTPKQISNAIYSRAVLIIKHN